MVDSANLLECSRVYRPFRHRLEEPRIFALAGALFGAVSILVVYLIAVANRDIKPFMAYISDASGDPPQSGLFGLCTTVMVVIGFPIFYLNYMNTILAMEAAGFAGQTLNLIALGSGFASCVGMIVIVTNPLSHLRRDGQWVKPILIPHVIGATIFFVSALIHMTAQTKLLCKLTSHVKPSSTTIKLILTMISGVSSLFMIAFSPSPSDMWTDPRDDALNLRNIASNLRRMGFVPSEPVFKEHVSQTLYNLTARRKYPSNTILSISAEWIFVLAYLTYFASYAVDLGNSFVTLDIYVLDPGAERATSAALPANNVSVGEPSVSEERETLGMITVETRTLAFTPLTKPLQTQVPDTTESVSLPKSESRRSKTAVS